MEWWINLLKVIGKMVVVIVMSAFMRLKYWINPSARKRDMEKKWKNGQNIARNNKYAPDPEDVAKNYLWSWKLIKKQFSVLMQDINKAAKEFGPAPNPELRDPLTGEVKQLLSVATKSGMILRRKGLHIFHYFLGSLITI